MKYLVHYSISIGAPDDGVEVFSVDISRQCNDANAACMMLEDEAERDVARARGAVAGYCHMAERAERDVLVEVVKMANKRANADEVREAAGRG